MELIKYCDYCRAETFWISDGDKPPSCMNHALSMPISYKELPINIVVEHFKSPLANISYELACYLEALR